VQFDIDERLAKQIDLAHFVRDIELKCWDRLEGLIKSRITIDQILKWADEHYQKAREWPNQDSGDVLGASGEKWRNIDASLAVGQRSLPGGSSLAQLLAEKRGVRNIADLPNLTVEQILHWVDAHHHKAGEWPKLNSGKVLDAPGEKWGSIENNLRLGLRGLPGGLSLAQLLAEKRGVRNHLALPPLTIEQILEWADSHHQKTGKWPNQKSGQVLDAPDEKWANINGSLSRGRRGLPSSASLAQLLAENRGLQNIMRLPDLTIDKILTWADAHHEKTGKWPNANSGDVLDTSGEKWGSVENGLRIGLRSLPGGSSLAQLLAVKRGARNKGALTPLNVEQILKWADAHHEKTGGWPNQKSGEVLNSSSERWANIDGALALGQRNLPGGSSLAKLLTEKRGVRNHLALPDLTIEQILKWADDHHKKSGKWPIKSSGEVLAAPGEKWGNIQNGLVFGQRGLPSGSTLAKLLAENRGVRNKAGLPRLTEAQILLWADAHHQTAGQWPNQKSGDVQGAPSEKWGNINTSLQQGLRGLPGGYSLAKLIESKRKLRSQ
jgi:hypothetical protein